MSAAAAYLAARLTDAWGELEAPGGVLVSKDWAWAAVPLKDATQSLTAGEGWSLKLSADWESVHREGGWALSRRR